MLVDVQGVGYEVDVPMSTFYNLPATGERGHAAHAPVVREDAHLLYGFGTRRASARCSGSCSRSPASARARRSRCCPACRRGARAGGHAAGQRAPHQVPGIGKKTAERLLLELKDKLGADLASGRRAPRSRRPRRDILNALLALGYSDKEALAAVKQLPAASASPTASRRR